MRASVALLQFPALVLALQATPGIVPAGKGLPQVTNVLKPELEAHGLSVIMPERASLANAGMGNYVLPNVYPAHFPAHLL